MTSAGRLTAPSTQQRLVYMKDHHISRGGVSRRYTIQFRMMPSGEIAEVRAVTPAGELMAAVMAYGLLLMKNPDVRIAGVEVALIEDDFTLDPANDAYDYWNTA
jgi:hypothetical protein